MANKTSQESNPHVFEQSIKQTQKTNPSSLYRAQTQWREEDQSLHK